MQYINQLIKESSPYLKQHAHNPVNWIPWSDDVFNQAQKEDKMVLISIGYSACHWCHVMEKECFEDEEVATLMNKFFINVKVDREERPDVDQIYMTAVQLMNQTGGWPLNCFTLPNGKPIYGGTYFPKEQWMYILKSLHETFIKERKKMEEYANKIQKGIVDSELIQQKKIVETFSHDVLEGLVSRWSKVFDHTNGGPLKAPKFPLPNNYEFLIDYALHKNDQNVLNHVELTLDKMAMGGIYDQIGGGFSRYSVDMLWKVPHFEKMLYDNAQLIQLYSIAYTVFKKPLYKKIVYQTIDWLEREMRTKNGAFYAALDADSEGEEGKFYVWKEDEFEKALGELSDFGKTVYEIGKNGYWENGNNILLRTKTDDKLALELNMSIDVFQEKLNKVNELLLTHRNLRIKPGLDDKLLTSWNAMTLKALCIAYATFNEEHFLTLANSNLQWLLNEQIQVDKVIHVWKNKTDAIDGFLEDYAHLIDGFISYYTISREEEILLKANELTKKTFELFFDEKASMFFFTSNESNLIARKMEITDSVIPSSNSVMARNLFYLSKYFRKTKWEKISQEMLSNVYNQMANYGSGYSNWAILLNYFIFPFKEILVIGNNSIQKGIDLLQLRLPKFLLATREKEQTILPIFEEKQFSPEISIQICEKGTCLFPCKTIEEVKKIILKP